MTHTLSMTDLSTTIVKFACASVAAGLLAACATDRALTTPGVTETVRAELAPAVAPKPAAVPARVLDALAEPAAPAVSAIAEPRIDLLVNDANAREVFLAIVADTRYSMLMHPDVAGKLSVTLRGVTVQEALEAIRDVYGYDFKIDGRRITIYAPTLQTRIFTINYPTSLRTGGSDLRVGSGAGPSNAQGTGNSGGSGGAGSQAGQGGQSGVESSRIATTSKSDFWTELADAVRGLVGKADGRNVIVSPQAGIMAVRGMPDELRQVEKFLKAAQIAVERQVMLEAKIVEVELRDGFQSGIDWSAFKNGRGQTGVVGTVSTTAASGSAVNNALLQGVQNNVPGFTANGSLVANSVSLPAAGGGLFGLAFATEGFQAILGFLETRGDVQILSSPRIATLNNQKAVLKVGTDEFFVTGVTSGTNTTANTTGNTTQQTMPSITMSSFFSGISLDVTPQIDDDRTITLHVHPSVSNVTEKTKLIDLGSAGNYRFPMASNSVNESDTVVRIQDGNIVAIGGLMQVESNRQSSGLPGTGSVPILSTLFNNKANSGRKKEVVVLIKPTIIRSAADWEAQNRRARAVLDDMDEARSRVIRMDGGASK